VPTPDPTPDPDPETTPAKGAGESNLDDLFGELEKPEKKPE
jgi:hypothetical protein